MEARLHRRGPNTPLSEERGPLSGSAATSAVYAIAETGMVCAAAGRKLRNMLRVEGKYLPGPQEHDGAMREETGRHGPENGDEPRRRVEAGATFEAACEATLEAELDPACEATFDPRIGRVLSAIEGNPFVTIGDLSRMVSLSHSPLSHLVKAAL